MSHASGDPFTQILKQYRAAMRDCEAMFREGASSCLASEPQALAQSPEEFLAAMDRLHRWLIVKVFVEVSRADHRWNQPEVDLAAEMIEHVFRKRLTGGPLRKAIEELSEQADSISWQALTDPFTKLSSLRDSASHVATVVTRMSNLVAKVDGHVRPDEVAHLTSLQKDLARHLDLPIPLDDAEPHHRIHDLAQSVAVATAEKALPQTGGASSPPPPPLPGTSPEEQFSAALNELDQLIGLKSIKADVRELANFLRMQRERVRLGLSVTDVTLHMIFSGNPGTGKTTVARIIGKLFGALGVLDKGHLVETDRSGLVAEYAGQSGPKTQNKVNEALDGVLFIDEAYSLVNSARGEDPFGAEAVQALLKRMEDDRHRLVVVLAGYPGPMQALLESNPGLTSRFNRHFSFPDYSAGELLQIFLEFCRKNHYHLPLLARVKLLLSFQYLLDARDEHFGNGRLVRNLFEDSIRRLANRVASVAPLTKELLSTLEPGDIQSQDVPVSVWQPLDLPDRQLWVTCPDCRSQRPMPQAMLTRRVRCKQCNHLFRAETGELIPPSEKTDPSEP